MAIANVVLTNTFNEWRTITNQLIVATNDILGDGLLTYRNMTGNVLTANAITVANVSAANILVSGLNVYSFITGSVQKSGNTMTGTLVMSGANLVMSSANIAFSTNANAGIYWGGVGLSFIHSPNSNVIIFGTSAAEAMRLDSIRRLGIGTSIPNANLHVAGNIICTAIDAGGINITSTLVAGYGQANIARDHANAAFLKANNVGDALITANSVMVRTTGNTMTGNLVMSGANIAFSTATNSGIYWSGTSYIHSPATNILVIGTSSTEDIRIDIAGNINVATELNVTGSGLNVTGRVSDAKANVLSQTLAYSGITTWDASLGRIATVTLSGATSTLANATNLRIGTYILHVIQDTNGGRNLEFELGYRFTGNVRPVLSTAPNARDVFSFVSDGTRMYGAMIPDVG